MIHKEEFEKFEVEFLKREKVNFLRNLKIVEALYKEAVILGVIPPQDPLEGLDVDIRIAKVVNSVLKTQEIPRNRKRIEAVKFGEGISKAKMTRRENG